MVQFPGALGIPKINIIIIMIIRIYYYEYSIC